MLKGKKQPENNIPAVLKATQNIVLSDLGNTQLKAGEQINLYAKFPAGQVRKSQTVKYALDRGILVSAVDEIPQPITPPTPAPAPVPAPVTQPVQAPAPKVSTEL